MLPPDDELEREEYKLFSKWIAEVQRVGLPQWIENHAKEPRKVDTFLKYLSHAIFNGPVISQFSDKFNVL